MGDRENCSLGIVCRYRLHRQRGTIEKVSSGRERNIEATSAASIGPPRRVAPIFDAITNDHGSAVARGKMEGENSGVQPGISKWVGAS